MTAAEFVQKARRAYNACPQPQHFTDDAGLLFACGYCHGERRDSPKRPHQNWHVALAIEADRAAVAREAYNDGRVFEAGEAHAVSERACVARLVREGGAP